MPPRKSRQNITGEDKMNRFRLLIGVAALFCAAVITGCVDTADNTLSDMEQEWARVIGESYPGHRIPKTMPPAVRSSVVVEDVEESKAVRRTSAPAVDAPAPAAVAPAPAVDGDPAAIVDNAAAAAPAADVVPEPKEQTAKADPAAVKSEAVVEKKPEVSDKKAAVAAEPAAPVAPAAGKNAEAVVKAGDTITGLAKEFYGDAKYYEVILKANPQIKNPKRLKIGTKLVIPAL